MLCFMHYYDLLYYFTVAITLSSSETKTEHKNNKCCFYFSFNFRFALPFWGKVREGMVSSYWCVYCKSFYGSVPWQYLIQRGRKHKSSTGSIQNNYSLIQLNLHTSQKIITEDSRPHTSIDIRHTLQSKYYVSGEKIKNLNYIVLLYVSYEFPVKCPRPNK